MFELRDYQKSAHTGIIENFRANLKTLLVMATGAGKSKTVISFIASIKDHYNFLLIVRGRKLVDQLSQDSKLFDLDYGVYMAQHDEYSDDKQVLVCSFDTILARGMPAMLNSSRPLVIITDEADQLNGYSYNSAMKKMLNRAAGRTFLLGMTATPYGDLSIFDAYIEPIKPPELRSRGTLVGYKYYIPRTKLNYDGIVLAKGQWSTKQISLKLNNAEMIKNCFNAWLAHGDNRKTLVFCVDKSHCIAVNMYINHYYGRTVSRFITDKTNDSERQSIIDEFNNGALLFIINVRVITRGVDIPIIGCILDCAPTLSINLHIQKLGRGSRSNPFYKDCIVIDMAQNCVHNGPFYMERSIDLSKKDWSRAKSDLIVLMRDCDSCFSGYEGTAAICPYCGFNNGQVKEKKMSKAAIARMTIENMSDEQLAQINLIKEYNKELWKFRNLPYMRSKDPNKSALYKLLKKYGPDKLQGVKNKIGLNAQVLDEWLRTEGHFYKPV